MATINDLSVQHSRNIGDPVAATGDAPAGADGNLFTLAQRFSHLNRAIRRWLLLQTNLKNYNALLKFITKVESTTGAGASSGFYTLSNILSIISVMCDNKFIKRGDESLFSQYQSGITNGNSFLAPSATDPVYIYNGGIINIFPASSFSSKSITIHYVKQWTDITAASGSEIDVPDHYSNQILDFALVEAMNEMPSEVSFARSKDKQQSLSTDFQLISEDLKQG